MNILCVGSKITYASARLEAEAKNQGIGFFIVEPRTLKTTTFNPKDFNCLYIRSGYPDFNRVTALAQSFQEYSIPVVDAEWCNTSIDVSKRAMYKQLQLHAIAVPPVYGKSEVLPASFPLVAKWQYGFGGKNIFFLRDLADFKKFIMTHEVNEFILQKYVRASFEYKVVTVGYQSVSEVFRYQLHPVQRTADLNTLEIIPKELLPGVVHLAESAARCLGRALSKVDILESRDGLSVLEVNRAPGLEAIEAGSGGNYFGLFINYLSRIGKNG